MTLRLSETNRRSCAWARKPAVRRGHWLGALRGVGYADLGFLRLSGGWRMLSGWLPGRAAEIVQVISLEDVAGLSGLFLSMAPPATSCPNKSLVRCPGVPVSAFHRVGVFVVAGEGVRSA